jgi:hypothetical protein
MTAMNEYMPPNTNITKQCECNPNIHTYCANNWFNKSGYTCPICLKIYSAGIVQVEVSTIRQQVATSNCAWDGLILSRNTHMWTMILMGIVVLILLCIVYL